MWWLLPCPGYLWLQCFYSMTWNWSNSTILRILFLVLVSENVVLFQTSFCLFLSFAVTMSPFCGATGTLCFRLWLTPPNSQGGCTITWALCHWHIMDPQSQLWLPRPNLVPILHLGMVRLPLEWLPNVTSRTAGTFEPTTSHPKAHCSTDWAIPAGLKVLFSVKLNEGSTFSQ